MANPAHAADIHDKEDEQAATFLSDIRFHQSFWLAADPQSNRAQPLRVTYSDLGRRDGPAVVWCGGVFGSRYTLAESDETAKRIGVRLLSTDKPGIGGSTGVEMGDKVKTWLDTIETLTKILSLPHISLIAHSSGTIYVLNALLTHHRHLLHPRNPYISIVSPWVHPTHSDTPGPSTGNHLPNPLIHSWYSASYMVTSHSTYPMLGPSTARPVVKGESRGLDKSTRATARKLMQYALTECVDGVSQEAIFCVRGAWGDWSDYEQYVQLLKGKEGGEQKGKRRGEQTDGDMSRLTVDVFFAESDSASGRKGGEWFDDCWKKNLEGNWVDYNSTLTTGTTHETIMRPEHRVLTRIFERVRAAG